MPQKRPWLSVPEAPVHPEKHWKPQEYIDTEEHGESVKKKDEDQIV